MSTPRTTTPRVTFQVAPEHIAAGQPRDATFCMIATALQAALPDAQWIYVDAATIRYTDQAAGARYVYPTPRHAAAALHLFEDREPVEPFTVNLRDGRVLPLGNARKARKKEQEPKDADAAQVPRRAATVPVKQAHPRVGYRREYGLRVAARPPAPSL